MTREVFMPLSGNVVDKVTTTAEETKTVETAVKNGFVRAEIGTLDNAIPVLVDLQQRICIPVPLNEK